MTTQKYIQAIVSMYGDFATEGMGRAVVNKIQQLSDTQRQKLFDVYCRTVPGNFKPDIKTTLEAMDRAGIVPGEKSHSCSCCGYKWVGTSYICPICNYSESDGDPREYYNEWQYGRGRFNRQKLQEMFNALKMKHAVKESDK